VQALLDFLAVGDILENFLDNYRGVSPDQVVAFLKEARSTGCKIA
jgi:uncharacterized protein (DUF433 family)